MQASYSAREILDARGRVEAVASVLAGLTCGRRRAATHPADVQRAALAPLPGPGAAVVLRDGQSPRQPPRRHDAAFAASSSEASSAALRALAQARRGTRRGSKDQPHATAATQPRRAPRVKARPTAPSERRESAAPNNATLTSTNTDLRQDPHGQDHHARRRAERHDRQREAEDPGQGGHPARPAASHFRGQAARGRPHALGLQHPEGVDAPPRLTSAGGGKVHRVHSRAPARSRARRPRSRSRRRRAPTGRAKKRMYATGAS